MGGRNWLKNKIDETVTGSHPCHTWTCSFRPHWQDLPRRNGYQKLQPEGPKWSEVTLGIASTACCSLLGNHGSSSGPSDFLSSLPPIPHPVSHGLFMTGFLGSSPLSGKIDTLALWLSVTGFHGQSLARQCDVACQPR